jgi:hypothetical protein
MMMFCGQRDPNLSQFRLGQHFSRFGRISCQIYGSKIAVKIHVLNVSFCETTSGTSLRKLIHNNNWIQKATKVKHQVAMKVSFLMKNSFPKLIFMLNKQKLNVFT